MTDKEKFQTILHSKLRLFEDLQYDSEKQAYSDDAFVREYFNGKSKAFKFCKEEIQKMIEELKK